MNPPIDPAVGWRPSAALYRGVAFAGLAIGLGITLGRPDLAVLGIPFGLSLALALSVKQPDPGSLPSAEAFVGGDIQADRPVVVTFELRELAGAQLVSVRTPDGAGEPGRGAATVPGGADTSADTIAKAGTWGTSTLARPDLLAASADALYLAGPLQGAGLVVTLPPEVETIGRLELPPIFGGWAGEHRSRRAGQGGDLIDLREYAPGDRLRSIHWRAYARHQKLFVRRTQSDADTDFVLCLDTRFDVVPTVRNPISAWQRGRARVARTWAAIRTFCQDLVRVEVPVDGPDPLAVRSSIDFTVAAAAAVTAAQLRAGDRVGILDLSFVRRHVRMGSGSRHLQRVRFQLATVTASKSRWMPTPELWGLPSSAVVVFLSPMIDDVAMQAGLDAAGHGHQVLVIDVLPVAGLMSAARRDPQPAATKEIQLLLAERAMRLDRLRHSGIPVLSWEAGQIATDLSTVMKVRRHRR